MNERSAGKEKKRLRNLAGVLNELIKILLAKENIIP
jgi:hypothetical protein